MPRTRRKVIDKIIVTFKQLFDLFTGMLQSIVKALTHPKVHLLLMAASFIGAQAVIVFGGVAFPFSIAGAACLGLLAGFAVWGWKIQQDPPVKTHTETIQEIVPYDQWPDQCYVCNDDIPDGMNYRGQYVVHKGEGESQTKAVPLCEECVWTYSTLMDNHDTLVGIYDCRDDPVEL